MNLRNLAKRLPSPVFRLLRKLYYLRPGASAGAGHLTPEPGPLLTEVTPRILPIPGWFNGDDLVHFWLVLEMQAAAGLTGDLLEIGCFHGRSAAVLAMQLRAGERLILCDAFNLPQAEAYGDAPTPERVRRNLLRAVPEIDGSRVEIIPCLSRDLRLPADLRLRFAHVDGGHSREEALGDLRLCARHLLPGGILVLDDYRHPSYPGVSEAAAEFLSESRDFGILADLNRRGALGRKLYLHRGV